MIDDDVEGTREERTFRFFINALGIDGIYINDVLEDCRDGLVLAAVCDRVDPTCVDWKKIDKNPNDALCQMFIKPLLKPKEGQDIKPGGEFPCKREHIIELANEVSNVFASQPIVIKEIRPPTKIVGDIHGQYSDLRKIFDMEGWPPEANYLFLGDY